MVGEWTRFRLGDICTKIGSGATPRGGSEVYLELGPYSLIRSQNIYNDGFHRDGLAYIDEKHAAELDNVEVLENDVLLNITGDSVARACQVDPADLPARVNQHVSIIRPNANVLDPRFLRYYLVSPEMQAKLLSWAGAGATRNALTKGMIESFEIPAPERISEQRAIAHVLGTLDDKIELNRRMNETLEAMARALFKSWFVDFDPAHAKAEGRDSALPKLVVDLFPDSFEDSELGQIPRGWRVAPIGELARIVGGSTPSTEQAAYWTGGRHYWATPKDLSRLITPVLLQTERKITEEGLSQIGSGLLPPGAVLLSSRAPIGYLAISEIPVAINQGFIGMLPADGIPNLFLLYWLHWAHEEIVSRANGSTFLEISKGSFRPIPVVRPPAVVLDTFEKMIRPFHARVVSNEREARALADLRDILLPRLISGELRVADVGRLVGQRK
jgi:type I restriction enzyme S subunit